MQEQSDIGEISWTDDGNQVNRYLGLGWHLLAVHQHESEGYSSTSYVLGWPRGLGKCKRPDGSYHNDPGQREDADWASTLKYRAHPHPVAEQRMTLSRLGERLESLVAEFNVAVSERTMVQATVHTSQQHCILIANNHVRVFTHRDGVDGALAVHDVGPARELSGISDAVQVVRQLLEQWVTDDIKAEN